MCRGQSRTIARLLARLDGGRDIPENAGREQDAFDPGTSAPAGARSRGPRRRDGAAVLPAARAPDGAGAGVEIRRGGGEERGRSGDARPGGLDPSGRRRGARGGASERGARAHGAGLGAQPAVLPAAGDRAGSGLRGRARGGDGAGARLEGLVWPKAEGAAEIALLDEALAAAEVEAGIAEGAIKIGVLIESVRAEEEAFAIAGASRRIRSLIFGAFDYFSSLGMVGASYRFDHPLVDAARMRITKAAASIGVPAIGEMTLNFPTKNKSADEQKAALGECRRDAEYARSLGFRGKWVGIPAQVDGSARGVRAAGGGGGARARGGAGVPRGGARGARGDDHRRQDGGPRDGPSQPGDPGGRSRSRRGSSTGRRRPRRDCVS